MSKRAFIVGVTGQDGAYLAHLLLKKGYDIFGTSRDAGGASFNNLKLLGIADKVNVISMALTIFAVPSR
jgi:GDPmannose 4,6-dehydratase